MLLRNSSASRLVQVCLGGAVAGLECEDAGRRRPTCNPRSRRGDIPAWKAVDRRNDRSGATMPLHFEPSEMERRTARLTRELAARQLDGLLLFSQNSMYWLTGYDTFGFCFFQCLYVGADGRTALLTPLGRSSPGAAHVQHRRHPHLEGLGRSRAGAGPRRHAGRPRAAGPQARDRKRFERAHLSAMVCGSPRPWRAWSRSSMPRP